MVPDLVYRFQMICFGGTYCIEQKTDWYLKFPYSKSR
jgi:hypothetical protein